MRRQAEALQASRARIVAAANAERRRIERNLHDGAQQHLVALAVKVRLARQLGERDPARANAVLEELGGEGARATVRLWEEAGGLLFEVTDDGVGFDTRSTRASAGFTNMNDRLGAIGGGLRVESSPGRGTKVAGAIPMAQRSGGRR